MCNRHNHPFLCYTCKSVVFHFGPFPFYLLSCLECDRSRVDPLELLGLISIQALLKWPLPVLIRWRPLLRCWRLLWRVCGRVVCAQYRRKLLNRWWWKRCHHRWCLCQRLLSLRIWLLSNLRWLLRRTHLLSWRKGLNGRIWSSLRRHWLWRLLLNNRNGRWSTWGG